MSNFGYSHKGQHMKIAIIGAGNMGGAVAAGLAKGNLVKSADIVCTARTQTTLLMIRLGSQLTAFPATVDTSELNRFSRSPVENFRMASQRDRSSCRSYTVAHRLATENHQPYSRPWERHCEQIRQRYALRPSTRPQATDWQKPFATGSENQAFHSPSTFAHSRKNFHRTLPIL